MITPERRKLDLSVSLDVSPDLDGDQLLVYSSSLIPKNPVGWHERNAPR